MDGILAGEVGCAPRRGRRGAGDSLRVLLARGQQLRHDAPELRARAVQRTEEDRVQASVLPRAPQRVLLPHERGASRVGRGPRRLVRDGAALRSARHVHAQDVGGALHTLRQHRAVLLVLGQPSVGHARLRQGDGLDASGGAFASGMGRDDHGPRVRDSGEGHPPREGPSPDYGPDVGLAGHDRAARRRAAALRLEEGVAVHDHRLDLPSRPARQLDEGASARRHGAVDEDEDRGFPSLLRQVRAVPLARLAGQDEERRRPRARRRGRGEGPRRKPGAEDVGQVRRLGGGSAARGDGTLPHGEGERQVVVRRSRGTPLLVVRRDARVGLVRDDAHERRHGQAAPRHPDRRPRLPLHGPPAAAGRAQRHAVLEVLDHARRTVDAVLRGAERNAHLRPLVRQPLPQVRRRGLLRQVRGHRPPPHEKLVHEHALVVERHPHLPHGPHAVRRAHRAQVASDRGQLRRMVQVPRPVGSHVQDRHPQGT